jgi:hypothetical protein
VFDTTVVEDREEGWIAVDLYSTLDDKRERVARVTYWDAIGGFTVETSGSLVPLVIIEELISEARAIVQEPKGNA